MILVDASGLLAGLDPADRRQAAIARIVELAATPLLLSPFVLAELDYLVRRTFGSRQQVALLEEVARGAYRLEPFSGADVAEARDVAERYSDLGVSLADASIVVLSRRHGVNDVLTLDERHFRVLRGAGDRPFRLLPADA